MIRRSAIVGLFLLLAGIAELGWSVVQRRNEQSEAASCRLKYGSEPDEYLKKYNEWLQLAPADRAHVPFTLNGTGEAKTKAQLRMEQQERLKADMYRLVGDNIDSHPFADVLYGENWEEKVREYKRRKDRGEFVFTGSVVCASVGGMLSAWCLLLWVVRGLTHRVSSVRKSAPRGFAEGQAPGATELSESEAGTDQRDSGHEETVTRGRTSFEKRIKIPLSQSRSTSPSDSSKPKQTSAVMSARAEVNNDRVGRMKSGRMKSGIGTFSDEDSDKISVLLSDGKSTSVEEPAAGRREGPDRDMDENAHPHRTADKPVLAASDEQDSRPEGSLHAQTENLEKQMAEFKQMAKSVQKTTLEHSKPLNHTLRELTQQVSAIREYAAYQQERVEKLQDGYDWNIIRTFCLRVIRCIDNLDSRIQRLSRRNADSTDLEEVRDELIFALESSGIEQSSPELNSEYRGQEKFAEAVKEKEHSDAPEKTGTIAEIVRPGYQYLINEENVKVVRTAQVKLYG